MRKGVCFVGCVFRADDEAAEEIETGVVGSDVDLMGGEGASEDFVLVTDAFEKRGCCWRVCRGFGLILVGWWLYGEDLEGRMARRMVDEREAC